MRMKCTQDRGSALATPLIGVVPNYTSLQNCKCFHEASRSNTPKIACRSFPPFCFHLLTLLFWFLPCSGPDHRFFTFQSPLARKQEQSQRSREDGIKTVQIFCGMLMEYVVPSGSWFGVDLPNRRIDAVVPAGLPEPKVSFTSIGDVAMAIASVARRRPNTLPDVIRISGDSCTLRQLGESWQNLTRSRVHIATTDLAAFKQSVIERNSSSVAHYYRLAAGEGLLDYSTTHANAWLSAGIQWQWKSIQQQIAGN